ncbi:hypothetical protein SDC9_196467 [bioreactor metagenome]|uniref:Uncharacterized protein n=1 Tax=bioreactor metagenome TaxID=1076179 RepID=A0A645IC45_9ZZZZ
MLKRIIQIIREAFNDPQALEIAAKTMTMSIPDER